MKIVRLAKLFELKYNFKSEAASLQEITNDIKNNIVNAHTLYINSATSKEPVLKILANAGEPFSKSLINIMDDTVNNIDELTYLQLFNRINKVLGSIKAIKTDPDKKVRNFINDNVRISKESDKNYREHLKSKFEMIIYRISSILEKQAKILQKFIPKETPLAGGIANPERKELSKDKLLMFMHTPAAQSYGLDSLDTLALVLNDYDLRQKLTTLINSIDRGHTPINGPEIIKATQEIADALKLKKDNSELFGEEKG